MKLSARNVLKGRITRIKKGPVSAEIVIELAPGVEVVSVITAHSAEELGLRDGMSAYAVIKADHVMVGIEH